jgi:putative flippase GtrA
MSQLFWYIIIGAIATGSDTALFAWLIHYVRFPYYILLLISWSVGVCINFALCDSFVFERNASVGRTFGKHIMARSSALFLNQCGMAFCVLILKMDSLIIARLSVSTAVFLLNFLMMKYFVFSKS